jgi:hypothetical protein
MQFTLLQNNVVAINGVSTIVMGMLFSCADTHDVSSGKDKFGKNLSSLVFSKTHENNVSSLVSFLCTWELRHMANHGI